MFFFLSSIRFRITHLCSGTCGDVHWDLLHKRHRTLLISCTGIFIRNKLGESEVLLNFLSVHPSSRPKSKADIRVKTCKPFDGRRNPRLEQGPNPTKTDERSPSWDALNRIAEELRSWTPGSSSLTRPCIFHCAFSLT